MNAIPIALFFLSGMVALFMIGRSVTKIHSAVDALQREYNREGLGRRFKRSIFGWAQPHELDRRVEDPPSVWAAKEKIVGLQRESVGTFKRAICVALGGMLGGIGVALFLALLMGR